MDLVYRDKEQASETAQNRTVICEIPWAAQDELYAELSKVSNVAALSPHERAVYDEHLRQYRDNLAMIEAAELDVKRGIARSLLSANMPDEFVSQHTGLLLDEVQKLRENL